MSAAQLLSLSLAPIVRAFRRWWLHRVIDSAERQLGQIDAEIDNAYRAQSYLHRRQAWARSELNQIGG